MAKIIGNTTATPNPRSDWNQTDETKADYIKNKPTAVSVLPENAKYGDVCRLVRNDITTADGGRKVAFNYDWLNSIIGTQQDYSYSLKAYASEDKLHPLFSIEITSMFDEEVNIRIEQYNGKYAQDFKLWDMTFNINDNGVFELSTYENNIGYQKSYFYDSTINEQKSLLSVLESVNIPNEHIYSVDVEKSNNFVFDMFVLEPILMIFCGEWIPVANESRLYEQKGALISSIEEIDKIDGSKFLRLYMNWGTYNNQSDLKNWIDIPISNMKETTEQNGNLTLNGSEIEFEKPDNSTSGIKPVSALPTVANEGDVVYYCPPANTLTAADSYHKVYVDMAAVEKLIDYCNSHPETNDNAFFIWINRKGEGIGFDFSEGVFTYYYMDGSGSIDNKCYDSAWTDGIFDPTSSEIADNLDGEIIYGYNAAPAYCYKVTNVDEDYPDCEKIGENIPEDLLKIFYVPPRFYRYINGTWNEEPYSEPELPKIADCTITDTSLVYALQPNVLYRFGEVAALNIDFADGEADKVNEYLFSFISGETATVLTLPENIVWANGKAFEAVPNAQYTVTVLNGVASFETTADVDETEELWVAIKELQTELTGATATADEILETIGGEE